MKVSEFIIPGIFICLINKKTTARAFRSALAVVLPYFHLLRTTVVTPINRIHYFKEKSKFDRNRVDVTVPNPFPGLCHWYGTGISALGLMLATIIKGKDAEYRDESCSWQM